MQPSKRWTRQLYVVSLILIVAVGLAAASRRILPNPAQHPHAEKPAQVGDWVYVSLKPNDTLFRFSGRPGWLISKDEDGATVQYQLYQSPAKSELIKVPASVPLHQCPPEQEGVYGWFNGTIRIWNGGEEKPLKDQTRHDAILGDTVCVEIKNLDRWLFEQFDFGRLKGELSDAPSFAKDVVDDAVAARRSADFLHGISEVNFALRVSLRETPATESSRNEAWQNLIRFIDNDTLLKRIKNKMPQPLEGENPTSENIEKLERQFLPIKVWSQRVTEKSFKQLTLTLNGVALAGITPQNAYNEAEVQHEKRPSFQEDLYQWARFVLERKQVDTKATEQANEVAKANQIAWFKLIGKPAFRLRCNVTLRLPGEGLELPTKVTTGAAEPDCQFQLIGIEPWKFIAAVIVFLSILLFLIWLAKTTNILRDSSGYVRADGLEPVSLAKTQMSFWFIVIACAFAFLWVTTGSHDTINDTCLILLGIGSGTALGAAFIESISTKFLVTSPLNRSRAQIRADITDAILARLAKLSPLVQDPDARAQFIDVLSKLEKDQGDPAGSNADQQKRIVALREQLQKEWAIEGTSSGTEIKEPIQDAIIALARKVRSASGSAPAGPAAPTLPSEVDVLAGELELVALQKVEFEKMPDTAWKRLFADWLSEGASDKYSFHRFQMLAWTLLLGFVFVAKVVSDRSMPEFNTMTLTLLGISAGTYLGFKFPEARKQDAVKSS
jgi:hypothetical protein